jgi:hypothetical protein
MAKAPLGTTSSGAFFIHCAAAETSNDFIA